MSCEMHEISLDIMRYHEISKGCRCCSMSQDVTRVQGNPRQAHVRIYRDQGCQVHDSDLIHIDSDPTPLRPKYINSDLKTPIQPSPSPEMYVSSMFRFCLSKLVKHA